MRGIFYVTVCVLLLLVGCGKSVTGGDLDFQKELNAIKESSTTFATSRDVSDVKKAIDDFNAKLDGINTKDKAVIQYVELQRKANDLRLEGITENDTKKINESTAYQAEALDLYYEIKGAN